jgi:hypothetical protein
MIKIVLAVILLFLFSCGGGSSSNPPAQSIVYAIAVGSQFTPYIQHFPPDVSTVCSYRQIIFQKLIEYN